MTNHQYWGIRQSIEQLENTIQGEHPKGKTYVSGHLKDDVPDPPLLYRLHDEKGHVIMESESLSGLTGNFHYVNLRPGQKITYGY